MKNLILVLLGSMMMTATATAATYTPCLETASLMHEGSLSPAAAQALCQKEKNLSKVREVVACVEMSSLEFAGALTHETATELCQSGLGTKKVVALSSCILNKSSGSLNEKLSACRQENGIFAVKMASGKSQRQSL